MTTATFVLWLLLEAGWAPSMSFPDPDLCLAAAERFPVVGMCLIPSEAHWQRQYTTKDMTFNYPRLEEMI